MPTFRGRHRHQHAAAAGFPSAQCLLLVWLWSWIDAAAAARSGSVDDPRVTSLPGYSGGDLCWEHSAGYLNAGMDHRLFYWYHEATEAPSEKPLVLWLNGGPGCSSLGGMFTELGPFVLDKDLNVTLNPYSWNQAANLLFLEQPAGVGFSHPNVPANDTSTAVGTDIALRDFFYRHQELRGRPVYVMGESYGGHYVPNTVRQIQVSNQGLPEDQRIEVRGFAVGNGYTDWKLDFDANVANGRFHALTSQARFEAAAAACDGDYARCFWPRDDVECPSDCEAAVSDATVDAMDGTIDIYDIYDDVCLEEGTARIETQLTAFLGHRRAAVEKLRRKWSSSSSASSRRDLRATIGPVFPTCVDDFTERYLNDPAVQKAIHVEPGTVPNGSWKDCGNVEYEFNYESELGNYRDWVAAGDLEMLIYNGDADYILSHAGNSAWIREGIPLTEHVRGWTKWRGSDGQVAGYFETYETAGGGGIPLTFLTVKGAGHMVPKDRPRHALDMLRRFLAGGQAYDEVEREPTTGPLCPARAAEEDGDRHSGTP